MDTRSLGARLLPDGTCVWNAWAPNARVVDLLLYVEDTVVHSFPMQPAESDYFCGTRKGIATGQRYAYSLDHGPPRPDPASYWQPEGVHAPSAVWNAATYRWHDAAWRGIARDELVIYELHVGTFTPEGTFASIVPRLAALRDLGITAIELMPVAQFPGRWGWGYDGVNWFAVQNSYGGPTALQSFVDSCHQHGMAVILDVVYNHLGPEGNYLTDFGPYFIQNRVTPWGCSLNYDGADCGGVRRFVLENARHWLEHFHLDGLRLDAVHAIHDQSCLNILAELKQLAADISTREHRTIHLIAESNLNDVRLLAPREQSGYELDAQWNDDFHHCVHALLTGERTGYYADFSQPATQLVKVLNQVFAYDGVYSVYRGRAHGFPVGKYSGDRFVVSIQTHDQVGNRARGDRLHALVEPAKQRCAAGLMLLSPYIPLLFMGEEYGELQPFPFFCDFTDTALREAVREGRRQEFATFAWQHEVTDPCSAETFASAHIAWRTQLQLPQTGLLRLYHDLLQLRRTLPALHDFVHRAAWLERAGRLLLLRRGDRHQTSNMVLAFFNLTAEPLSMEPDMLRDYRMVLDSEADGYGGARRNRDITSMLPHELIVFERSNEPLLVQESRS
jgi:maltooligosyltrehalose trehalohydrolase